MCRAGAARGFGGSDAGVEVRVTGLPRKRKIRSMDLTPAPSMSLRGRAAWPNLFVFPKELRDAIPDYGARALVFDAVSGSTNNLPAEISGLAGAMPFEVGPRAQAQFLVHESGKLDGKFVLGGNVGHERVGASAKVDLLTFLQV